MTVGDKESTENEGRQTQIGQNGNRAQDSWDIITKRTLKLKRDRDREKGNSRMTVHETDGKRKRKRHEEI